MPLGQTKAPVGINSINGQELPMGFTRFLYTLLDAYRG